MRELIKQRRKELKLTQAEVAERMNVGHATIGRYENGQTPLNEATIKQFSEALMCDLQEELLSFKIKELLQEQNKFRDNIDKGIIVYLCDLYDPDESCEDDSIRMAEIQKNGKKYIIQDYKLLQFVNRLLKHAELEFDYLLESENTFEIHNPETFEFQEELSNGNE